MGTQGPQKLPQGAAVQLGMWARCSADDTEPSGTKHWLYRGLQRTGPHRALPCPGKASRRCRRDEEGTWPLRCSIPRENGGQEPPLNVVGALEGTLDRFSWVNPEQCLQETQVCAYLFVWNHCTGASGLLGL
ncbi:putative Phospholipid-Transporting Atpase Vd [Manis pentadactyla]|nr:putative Phospholipid-Transporting Atpase Vd [Manis pentadactyla]